MKRINLEIKENQRAMALNRRSILQLRKWRNTNDQAKYDIWVLQRFNAEWRAANAILRGRAF